MVSVRKPQIQDVTAWIFDLDNTLYPATSGVGTQVAERMTDFIVEQFDLNRDDAFQVRRTLFMSHGTTLRGLMSAHAVDPHHYLDYVHDIDLSVLSPDPVMREALISLPGRRFIHTNASARHAENVLARLGIADLFDGVFDITASEFLPKPDPFGYRRLMVAHNIDSTRAAMVEDLARNLRPAADMGMVTIWVDTDVDWAREGSGDRWVHHRTNDLAAWLRDSMTAALSPVDSDGTTGEFDHHLYK